MARVLTKDVALPAEFGSLYHGKVFCELIRELTLIIVAEWLTACSQLLRPFLLLHLLKEQFTTLWFTVLE